MQRRNCWLGMLRKGRGKPQEIPVEQSDDIRSRAELAMLHLKYAENVPEEAILVIGISPQEAQSLKFVKGDGCEKCKRIGYRGRTGLFEVVTIDRELARVISSGESTDKIRERAVEKGLVTIEADARRKVLDGITTAEEAASVLDPVAVIER